MPAFVMLTVSVIALLAKPSGYYIS